MPADTPQYSTARKRKTQAKSKASGANLGFEGKLWQTADKLRGHMDPAECLHVVLSGPFGRRIFGETA
jgi:hypothetical protein